jgi:hypothetical protein
MPSIRIIEFDTWRPGYGLATVTVNNAGSNSAASIFTDEALTIPAGNPQTLQEKTDNGISYGKFSQPIYVGVPYELVINTVDRTGTVRPPLTTLDSQDASNALVTVTGGSEAIDEADRWARQVNVLDYGPFIVVGQQGASASTNNQTLVNAIGAAESSGGGYVDIPAGTFQVTNFTVPQGVVLRGRGRGATIIQSQQAGNVCTVTGERAGLHRITLDGINKVVLSVGVYSANTEIYLDDVEIKRFETGIFQQGAPDSNWRELYLSNCGTGFKAYGDTNASGGANGGAFIHGFWNGGTIDTCTVAGIEFKNVDAQCQNFTVQGVKFDTNTGTAVIVTGARNIKIVDPWFTNNTVDISAADGSPLTTSNTVIGLQVIGGIIESTDPNTPSSSTLTGTLLHVAFVGVDLTNTAININTPLNNILAQDCREISNVSIGGNAPTAWVRVKAGDRGASSGLTTGNATTRAWGITLQPGQRVCLIGRVVARGRSTTDYGFFYIQAFAQQPGATLAYRAQTVNFAAGNVVTGGTSNATARIVSDSDSGATGTLTLQDISGVFQNGETITDTGGGTAVVNGILATSNSALVGSVTTLATAQKSDVSWAATFAANGTDIELQVTGASGKTVEWTTDVQVLSS